jgi:type IV secretory pathway VirJ component
MQAAIILADILAKRIHGNRPVVLVGFSFGARMIFMALENLANRQAWINVPLQSDFVVMC